jgi:Zn-dependent protease
MNLVLALLALTTLGVWFVKGPAGTPIYDNVQVFLTTGGWLNLFLACFNLMPFPPLDGSKVAAGLLPPVRPLIESPEAQQYGWIAIFACGMLGLFAPIERFCKVFGTEWALRVATWVG